VEGTVRVFDAILLLGGLLVCCFRDLGGTVAFTRGAFCQLLSENNRLENNKKKSEKEKNKGLLKNLIIGSEIANRAPT
jgi:hypothetical protein